MTRLLVEIARWLGNKIMILVVIVAVLLVSGWIAMEYVKLKERLAEADTTERLIENLETELSPLRERREALEAELAEVVKQVGKIRDLRDQALLAERNALRHLQKTRDGKRWYYTKLTHPNHYAQVAKAELAHAAAAKVASAATVDFDTVRASFKDSQAGRELVELNQQIDARAADISLFKAKVLQDREDAASHPFERLRRQTFRVLPTALAILAVVILLPFFVKACLYFVVAPLITRASPVRLLPDAGGEVAVATSGVSVPIELGEGDELIVHSDYLQAAGAGPGKKTRFLFSWKMPFTSLAAGLFLMVSIRNPGRDLAKVTISPKRDLFDKLSHVSLPKGSAMVVYPRSLVGAVLRGGEAPHITRHWRLGNLHSWLTFQFRHLVVHGPCDFIVKGCRGVRAGEVTPENPRMQDQCATLGFTANLEYSSIRCETFIDYLRGRDGLFNDRFANATGYHLTEEIPDPRRKVGLFGRGIEGIVDGVLKGFGI